MLTRLLHRAAEGDAALELGRDVLGHELRVGLGLAHLLDVDEQLVVGELLQLFLELLHAGAAAADDDARARGRDHDLGLVRGALDRDAGDARVRELLADRVTQLRGPRGASARSACPRTTWSSRSG